MTELSDDLKNALQNPQFLNAIERLATGVRGAVEWGADNFEKASTLNQLLVEHQLGLLESLAGHSEDSLKQEFFDAGNLLNPIRRMWALCYQGAENNIRATNLVNTKWTTTAQDIKNLEVQKNLIKNKKVKVERIFIMDYDSLPPSALQEVRYAMLTQLSVGIKLRVAKPQQIIDADTKEIGTSDFIIFDNRLVYATEIDVHDTHDRKRTRVKLYTGQDYVDYAKEAWDEIYDAAQEVKESNLHEFVDPRFER